MIPIMETVLMLFSFLFSYFLLFVWIPSLFVRFEEESSSMLDKLFISLTHSTLFYMIFVHLLIGIRLLETVTLFVITIGSIVLLSKYYSQSESVSSSIKIMVALFDLTENRDQWRIELKRLVQHLKNRGQLQLKGVKKAIFKHPILIIAFLLVFGVAMTDRFRYAFTHLSFASSDSYVHLGWSKYMSNMSIYMDGVYPYGFESIISTIYDMFGMDMYVIVRFMGALTVLLMMLSLVYALRKMIGRDYITILLTVFLLFFSNSMMFGNSVILWRQLSALSMEFATIFIFPGITFFYLFFKSNKHIHLLLAAECYAITAFTHPFVAVNLTLAFIAMGISYYKIILKANTWIRIIMYMGIAGFIGILPPIIGLLTGKPFHGSSLNYIKNEFEATDTIPIMETLITFANEQLFISIIYLCLITYLFGWIIFRYFYKEKEWVNSDQAPLVMAGLFMMLMMTIYLSPQIGLPSIVPVDRQPVFLSMSAALLFGIVFGSFSKILNGNKLQSFLQIFACSLIMLWVLLIPGEKVNFPLGDQHQYDESIRAYLDIKENYPLKNWDIISPVDELGLIQGYGYHTEIWEFVRNIEDKDREKLEFKTSYVFLFIEKIPIDIANEDIRPIAIEDAEAEFPVITNGSLTEFYYGNVKNRRIIQAKAYYWAEHYMKNNKNNKDMKVIMDTPYMKIYEIYQGKNEVILTKGKQVTSE